MKHRFFLTAAGVLAALLAAFVLAGEVRAQRDLGEEALHDAFVEGDAKALLAKAAGRVELNLPGGGSQYSRSQAVYVLQQFFDKHPPRRFDWEHASSGERTRFLTGRYWHEGAQEPLLVHLRLAKGQGEWWLHEVRIRRP